MDSQYKSCVLLLDLPPSAFAGIDLLSFTTTPRFHGIKYLPPGWHFVFVSPSNSFSLRHGAWFKVKASTGPPELFIKRWDTRLEELVPETDPAATLRWRTNLGSIWNEGLSPYRQTASQDAEETEEVHDWPQMTDCLSDALLARITGGQAGHHSLTSASSAKRDMDDIPGLSKAESAVHQEKELTFLPIDLKRTWREGATGRERTEAAQDFSWALGDLVENHCARKDEMEILGEMQFTFLMVLTLNNHSCLEQWKRILSLLFRCRAAVTQRPKLFIKALATLRLQLRHCEDVEGGLFDFSDDGGALLKMLLKRFKKGLEQISGKEKSDVVDELEELESFLTAEYGWDLDESFMRKGMLELEDGEQIEVETKEYDEDDETGEYAPTVVELTDDQMEALSGPRQDPEPQKTENVDNGAKNELDEEEEEQEPEELDSRF